MMMTLHAEPIAIDGQFILLILKEAIVWSVYWVYCGYYYLCLQVAGAFIDFQMGFAIANVIDPQTGAHSPLTGQFLYMHCFIISSVSQWSSFITRWNFL